MFIANMFVRKVKVGKETKIILAAIINEKDAPSLENETLYYIAGLENQAKRLLISTVGKGKDIMKEAEGLTIDGVLQLPIWRTGKQ